MAPCCLLAFTLHPQSYKLGVDHHALGGGDSDADGVFYLGQHDFSPTLLHPRVVHLIFRRKRLNALLVVIFFFFPFDEHLSGWSQFSTSSFPVLLFLQLKNGIILQPRARAMG